MSADSFGMGCAPSVLDAEVNANCSNLARAKSKHDPSAHNNCTDIDEEESDGESASLLCANLRRNFASSNGSGRGHHSETPARAISRRSDAGAIVSCSGTATETTTGANGADLNEGGCGEENRILNQLLLANVCEEQPHRNTPTTYHLPHYLQHHSHHQFHPASSSHRKFSVNISEKVNLLIHSHAH